MDGFNLAQICEDSPASRCPQPVTFSDWVGRRSISCLGTNAGAEKLPFQQWRWFKEAFAPELIARAVEESEIVVKRCIDPFGGSGTTALACQYLGIDPITIEVNPYLADLIESKLHSYDVAALQRTFSRIVSKVNHVDVGHGMRELKSNAPATFIEPGENGNFVFFRDVLRRIIAYREVIEGLRDPSVKRLFRVLLGAITIPVSNVTISGKGRRYRGGWLERRPTAIDVDRTFAKQTEMAFADIRNFGRRACSTYTVLRGDARQLLRGAPTGELAVFSPPYPNSADYTDVYNVELWTMGYIGDWNENIKLRRDTLTSHVQLKRQYASPPRESKLLTSILTRLGDRRSTLWHPDIPEMIGAYFADLCVILKSLHTRLAPRGRVYIVIGDSRYANVKIPAAAILCTLAHSLGYTLVGSDSFRSMRVAPQQGGQRGLSETLIILRRD
jgi:hypothetical protein